MTQAAAGSVQIDRVRIANFRSLQNVEVDLKPTTILVGMNNAGKTSFLRALHLALGMDRRVLETDDFFVGDGGNGNATEAKEILIDIRVIPVNSDGDRAESFDQKWIDTDFGGDLVSLDDRDNEFIAVRTRISFDSIRNDFAIDRSLLKEWPIFEKWQEATTKGKAPRRFEHLASFFIDAQRDVVADLRNRSSYIGKLLSKIEISEDSIADIEERLRELNADIVANSEVLSHVGDMLKALNQTVSSFGEGVEITPVSKKLRDITKGLDVQFNDSDASSFPLESHGMGTRSWASLLTYQAYVSWLEKQAAENEAPFHPILILEEPEAHLHPDAQRSVYSQLRAGLGQKIVSTHSPYIAGQGDLETIRHFSKHGSSTRITGLAVDELEPEDLRKIRREVMRTRGELLFSRAVVLFEGETEEQALPMFARAAWTHFPFELGASFVGVGGEGNYLPFLRVFNALQVPWYIFSDGEPNARNRVKRALENLDESFPHDRVVILPDDHNIEGYLLSEGYHDAIKTAIIEFHRPFANERHESAKSAEIYSWDEAKLREFMDGKKTAISAHWAQAILNLEGDRRIPGTIKTLLDKVEAALRRPGGEI